MENILTIITFIAPFVVCGVHALWFTNVKRLWVFVLVVVLTFILAILSALSVKISVSELMVSAVLFAVIYAMMSCGICWVGLKFLKFHKADNKNNL